MTLRVFFVLTLVSFAPSRVPGQGWGSITGGTPSLLHDITFVGHHGWAAGKNGTILHSTNGGYSWAAQTSGSTSTLHSISFTDSVHGWVTGEPASNVSTVLHTTDGGTTWVPQTVGTVSFFECHFINQSTGWLVGASGTIGYGAGWAWSPYWGSIGMGSASTTVSTYDKGTLVVDIWDAKTKEIVWRGSAVAAIPEDPKKAEKLINKALEKMVKQFDETRAKEAKATGK